MIHTSRERGRWIGRADATSRARPGVENEPIGLRHDARRAHGAARAPRHDLVGLREMLARALDDARTDPPERRARQHRRRIARRDTGIAQRLGRQIEASEGRVFVEVAQDVGELQRPSQVVRERNAVLFLHSEHPDRQPPDRARDPVAVEIERRLVGRADIPEHVHLHSVDDGMKILAPQPEFAHRHGQTLRARGRLAGIERVDIGAPALELLAALAAGAARIRDVVDLPAK